MQEILLNFMGEYGAFAVFLLILIENLFPPIPSEVILAFGGVMTTCTSLTVPGVVVSATAGSVLGALLLYGAGYLVPEELLGRMAAGHLGQLLHFEPEDVELAKRWFLKKGTAAVFLCRLVPVVRSLISIPAGISKMKLLPFLFLTAAGSLLWNTALVFLGKAAGDSWEKVTAALGVYSNVFLVILGSGMLLAVMIWQIKTDK